MALVFKEGLGVPHIGSVVGVGGEHGVVSVGLGALLVSSLSRLRVLSAVS